MAEPKTFKVKDKDTGKIFTIREKTKEASLTTQKPSILSESLKVALQGVSGASQNLLDITNKPISELTSGEVGSRFEEGYLIGKKIRTANKEDIASTIKRFVNSGLIGIAESMESPRDTLSSKYGFPSLPQPETGVGKALGIVANIVGQGLVLGRLGQGSRNANLKMPSSSQIDKAISTIDSNVTKIKSANSENLFRTHDGIEVNAIEQSIKDNHAISQLELNKTKLSDSISQEIQGSPGNKGLGVKASKKLGEEFYKEYQKYAGEEVYVDDVLDGIGKVLQKYGIIDGKGERVPESSPNQPQAKVLNFYESLKGNKPNDIIQIESKKVTLGEFDKGLKSLFGKGRQYGSEDYILTDIRHAMSNYVSKLREVGTEFAPDFQLRNAVYDKFHIFDRIGFRRGSGDQSSGMKVLENLGHENPAGTLPQNERMMDFLKEYSGKDPSSNVRNIGTQIRGIKQASEARKIASKILILNMERDKFNTELKASKEADLMKEKLGNLKISARIREARTALKKKVAIGAGLAATLAVGGPVIHQLAKKVIPFLP